MSYITAQNGTLQDFLKNIIQNKIVKNLLIF